MPVGREMPVGDKIRTGPTLPRCTGPGGPTPRRLNLRTVDHAGFLALVLFVAEVPGDQDVLTLGITVDALAVATELRIVRWEQHQAGVHTITEGLDHPGIAERGTDLPVGGGRAQVDDLHIADRRLWW